MPQAAGTMQYSPERDWRALREATGLSLREVARRTGINPGVLSQIETRRMFPEPREAAALLSVYGWQGPDG